MARPKLTDAEKYEKHKEAAATRVLEMSAKGREIGDLPAVQHPEVKLECSTNLRLFAETYFPETFSKKWSDDHLKVIAKIERAVLTGGLFAMAMPRGSGKTSLCEVAAIWAMLYGHSEFVMLIGADEDHASNMLDAMKVQLAQSEELAADFPEVCYPLARLEGITLRAKGQTFQGKSTHISMKAGELVLPAIPGSPASNACVRVRGITGRIRGQKFMRPYDQKPVRPTLVLLDDPQTDESARSPSQIATREKLVNGAILGLAGPGEKIAGLAAVTVIEEGDLADRLLDPARCPEWQGERMRMLYEWPDNMGMWEDYGQLRQRSLEEYGDIRLATEFYRKNRKAMDAGARVAWKARFNHDEISALQCAMNLWLKDEPSFFAEYQNQPELLGAANDIRITPDLVLDRLNGYDEAVVPKGCTHVTAMIDVQQQILVYTVMAWREDFTGHVIAYGTEPEQRELYWRISSVKRTIQQANPKAGLEGALMASLKSLTDRLFQTAWHVDGGGGQLRIEKCMIDANWGRSTDTVYEFCRRSDHGAILQPAHGRYVGAGSQPLNERPLRPGERAGLHWRMPLPKARQVRHVLFDSNWWKSFIASRLHTQPGDPGCMTVWGKKQSRHQMFADQLSAEVPIRTEGRGRTVDEWKPKGTHEDNHFLDCAVGAAVAASMLGCTVGGTPAAAKKRKRYKLSDRIKGRRD